MFVLWYLCECRIPHDITAVRVATEAVTDASFIFFSEPNCIMQSCGTKAYSLRLIKAPILGSRLMLVVNQQTAFTVLCSTDYLEPIDRSPLVYVGHVGEFVSVRIPECRL